MSENVDELEILNIDSNSPTNTDEDSQIEEEEEESSESEEREKRSKRQKTAKGSKSKGNKSRKPRKQKEEKFPSKAKNKVYLRAEATIRNRASHLKTNFPDNYAGLYVSKVFGLVKGFVSVPGHDGVDINDLVVPEKYGKDIKLWNVIIESIEKAKKDLDSQTITLQSSPVSPQI